MSFGPRSYRSSTIIRSFFSNACFVVSTTQNPSTTSQHRRQQSQMQYVLESEVCGTAVDFTAESVRSAVVRTCLKTIQECVRLCSFNRSGFQQLQVDLRYLRRIISQFASGSASSGSGSNSSNEDAKIVGMLDGIENDAKERCNDPTPLDNTVIEHILKLSEASHQRI